MSLSPIKLSPGFPRTFGPYILLGPLAQGGMGEVFLASTRGCAGAVRLVVIKTLRPDLVNEPGYVARFLDEARIVIQLQHSNICQVFDVGQQDEVHFFAMEHIAGTNLRRLVDATDGLIPTPLALFIAAEILDGLDSAHRNRHALTGEPLHVVHRDVSPHNVMLSYEGEVKIIDFGLAASELKMEHTGSQVVLGKIAYMSPEQARGEHVDARSDQFSAAIILYELLCGERYYGERSQREIWSTAGSRFVPPGIGSVDPQLAAILARALAFDANDRFESCGDFASAIRTVMKMRYPFAERASLRSFVREALVDERAHNEATMHAFGQLALSAMPSDGSQTASSILPAHTLASSTAASRGWQPAIAAAAAGLMLGAVGVLFALSLTKGEPRVDVPRAPTASAVHVAPLSPDHPVSLPPPTLPLPAIDLEPVRPLSAPVSAKRGVITASTTSAASSTSASTTATTVAATTMVATPVAKKIEPLWSGWSLDKRIRALDHCSVQCAKTLRRLRADGIVLQPAAVDACLQQCPTDAVTMR